MSGYLDRLNATQRVAATYGVENAAGPLLVIAGAGSGKTTTLANRVAHLLVAGWDPRRILTLTFSRRAAAEMSNRIESVSREVLGERARTLVEGLEWSGTFTASALGFCASMPALLASIQASRSTTEKTRPTS